MLVTSFTVSHVFAAGRVVIRAEPGRQTFVRQVRGAVGRAGHLDVQELVHSVVRNHLHTGYVLRVLVFVQIVELTGTRSLLAAGPVETERALEGIARRRQLRGHTGRVDDEEEERKVRPSRTHLRCTIAVIICNPGVYVTGNVHFEGDALMVFPCARIAHLHDYYTVNGRARARVSVRSILCRCIGVRTGERRGRTENIGSGNPGEVRAWAREWVRERPIRRDRKDNEERIGA